MKDGESEPVLNSNNTHYWHRREYRESKGDMGVGSVVRRPDGIIMVIRSLAHLDSVKKNELTLLEPVKNRLGDRHQDDSGRERI